LSVDGRNSAWLSIIGIGEDGIEGLSPAARTLIATAELVAGGERHLKLVGRLARHVLRWPSPLDKAVPQILALRGRPVVVLASGDPFNYGIGVTLARHIAREEIFSVPQPSAFSLAANRLGWALQDTVTIGLNGRAIERLIPHLHPGTRILALSANAATPAAVASLLSSNGFAASTMIVLEAMAGKHERTRFGKAGDIDLSTVNPLNTIAIEVSAGPNARIIARASGLPDEWFEHDGQITKREIRAITLSSLAPCRGEHLWDIGCGSGSVAIEWMLSDASCRATGIDVRADRAARAARNALRFGVPDLSIEVGAAVERLARLTPPNAAFVGGGASDPSLIDAVWSALPCGGRLVVNAVTLQTEAVILAQYASKGGALRRLSIERADKIGQLTAWRPAMPVLHWSVIKP
jgi:precorrin-6Y C5,15-methyltransferase (decarboxylating)